MKFAQVVQGTKATKVVTFRLLSAPYQPPPPTDQVAPGATVVSDPAEKRCRVRVLSEAEQIEIFRLAEEGAAAKGVKEWKPDHPICRLYQMAHTILVACVDADDPSAPYFDSLEQITSSHELGSDNIALLYEAQDEWQTECTFGNREKKLELGELLHILTKEAERPENSAEATPYDALRPGSRKALVRSTAILLFGLLKGNSDTGSFSDSNTKSGPTSTNPSTEPRKRRARAKA